MNKITINNCSQPILGQLLKEVGVQMNADIELEYHDNKSDSIQTTKARMIAYIDPASGKKTLFI